MSLAHGYNAFFGWAKETTYGTQVTPPSKFVECESISTSDDRKLIHKPLLGHVGRRRVIRDKHAPGIGLKFPFVIEGIEQLIEAAIGGVVTTGAGPTYTHTYALAASLPVGFTSYVDIDDGAISGDHVQRVSGCQIDKLTLTQEMGGTLDVELEIMGREFDDVARTTPSLPTYTTFDYGLMTLATINPASTNYELLLRKFKLSIENNLFKDKYRLTGAGKRAGFGRSAQRNISLEIEVEYESDTVLAYFKNATSTDLRFKWVSGSNSLTITTPAGYFQGNRPAAGDTGPVYMTMNYDSLVSATDNDELGLVLVNTVSAVG